MPGAPRSSALLVAAAALLGAPEAEARPGDVVRVERPRGFAAASLRLCPVNVLAHGHLTCFGQRPPEPGTRFVVLDGKGSRGEVTTRRVEPSDQDACRLGYAHDVAVDGALTNGDMSIAVAIHGLEDMDRARLLSSHQRSPSGRDDEQVWTAIDRNGDDLADVLATYRECSATADLPPAPAGKTVQGLCLDYWTLRGSDWRRVGSDVFFACR